MDKFFDDLQPPVHAERSGHFHRVYLTANQKKEVVGDGDRKFCHRYDSVEMKTGRLVLHYGSIVSARAAAPTLLGHLARSVVSSKLPVLPDTTNIEEIGRWAAKIISKKPEAGGTWQRAIKIKKLDTQRPTLGMRAVEVSQAAGTNVMVPVAAKKPRTNPIAAAKARQSGAIQPKRRTVVDVIDEDCSYDSFNQGFQTDSRPLNWSGRSKRARKKRAIVAALDSDASSSDSDPEWQSEESGQSCVIQ